MTPSVHKTAQHGRIASHYEFASDRKKEAQALDRAPLSPGRTGVLLLHWVVTHRVFAHGVLLHATLVHAVLLHRDRVLLHTVLAHSVMRHGIFLHAIFA